MQVQVVQVQVEDGMACLADLVTYKIGTTSDPLKYKQLAIKKCHPFPSSRSASIARLRRMLLSGKLHRPNVMITYPILDRS